MTFRGTPTLLSTTPLRGHTSWCVGIPSGLSLEAKRFLFLLGLEHIHRMLSIGSTLLTFEIYFERGDASRPTPPLGVRPLYFSEKPVEVMASVPYTIRVDEFTVLPGARWDVTPREPLFNYVLEGIKTRRVADQMLRDEPGSVLELPIGTRFTVSNEGTTLMRFLAVMLVPIPVSGSPR